MVFTPGETRWQHLKTNLHNPNPERVELQGIFFVSKDIIQPLSGLGGALTVISLTTGLHPGPITCRYLIPFGIGGAK